MLSHISFGEGKKSLAILVPTNDLNKDEIRTYYVEPLVQAGIAESSIIALNLMRNAAGKSPVAVIRPWLEQIHRIIQHEKIDTVLCCDGNYFKTLCKVTKSDPHLGYPKATTWPGVMAFVCPNYSTLFYNPGNHNKIAFAMKAVLAHMTNQVGVFDANILKDVRYPFAPKEIAKELDRLHQYPAVTLDIETHSLKVDEAGIISAAFGINCHEAVAFPVGKHRSVRALLKQFIEDYRGTIIYHGSPYDTKVLIWELFMDGPQDIEGMVDGLHAFFRDLEDTKIIAYLALNTTSELALDLKSLAFEYTGNYALDDMSDLTQYSIATVLKYNAFDAVATWWVYDRYRQVVRDEQEAPYQNVFRPALKVITAMELAGMPMNLGQVLKTENDMQKIARKHFKAIMNHPIIIEFNDVLRDLEAEKANKKLKKLRKTRADFLSYEFNPNSNTQLAVLLHEHLKLPVLETTRTKAPSTKAKVLKALVKHVERGRKAKKKKKHIIALLENIIELHDVSKILNTFIPAFKENSIMKEGWSYLHGGFNLGGTKSGRLSSSKPNLQNIPSGGTQYAKPIKRCFQAPPHYELPANPGWLMVGADFSSLEDRISALQTEDPNKLKIYIDGYDGHCLRAYAYFGDQMPDIINNNVQSINSISKKYPHLRQESKSPTFLLTYMGTWHGLIKTFGFSKEQAKQIEKNYHELYSVSDEWVQERLKEASKKGYVELAFGLRLRTPILPQVIIGSDTMPFQAHKEMKTAGNALGQSYGLLNTRAGNEFMERVWESEYKYSVLPLAQIHDAQYFMIRNTLGCLKWVNDNLIECMEWNDLPEIQHDVVKLEAELEVYYPDWSTPISIPNGLSLQELKQLLKDV